MLQYVEPEMVVFGIENEDVVKTSDPDTPVDPNEQSLVG